MLVQVSADIYLRPESITKIEVTDPVMAISFNKNDFAVVTFTQKLLDKLIKGSK